MKLTSPGPVFYEQEHCGLNGKQFKMLKLRGMRPDAEKSGAGWTGTIVFSDCPRSGGSVVAWSPDHATLLTEGLLFLEKRETFGQIPWRGQETTPQQTPFWDSHLTPCAGTEGRSSAH